jgi:hypothetical protein
VQVRESPVLLDSDSLVVGMEGLEERVLVRRERDVALGL